MNKYDPKNPTSNKPGSLAWLKEIFVRWLGFMRQGFKEVVGAVRGKN